jgi:TonB family protein
MALLKMTAATSAAVLALSAGSALAQDQEPNWLKRPSAQDLMSVWPTAAMKTGRGGKAVIACTVTIQGALRDCRVVSESPVGAGFGPAGVTLSAQLLMKPATHNGQPVEGTVRIPITWPDIPVPIGSHMPGQNPMDPRPEKVISNIQWLQAPSFSDVLSAYPEKAKAANVGGRVTLDCVFSRAGMLSRCDVLQEAPNFYGFGGAARRLAGKFVGPTTDSRGASLAGAHVQLPVVFAAESLASVRPVIGRPQWTAIPAAAALMAVYPRDAAKVGVLKARVVLSCTVVAEGALSACKVESEEPAGYGVGKATLQLAPSFRLGIWTSEGLPTLGGGVRVPIRYDFTDAAAPPKP